VWFIFLVEVDMALNQIPVTIIGASLMKEELARLRSTDRPEVIQAIAEARAQGDLSENAEYEAAKEKQSFIEGRIAELESKLSNLFVIDPKTLHAEGRVVFGATVRFEDLKAEKSLLAHQLPVRSLASWQGILPKSLRLAALKK
jgi:transcription elongation factor GreA